MPWLLLIPGIVLGLIASIRLRWMCRKYGHTESTFGLTGFEAARKILDANQLAETPIIEIPGRLTDHYDLLKHQLCLSTETYRGRSVLALGIAAHEAGHALQNRDDGPLRFRTQILRLMNFALPISIVLIAFGLLNATAVAHNFLLAGAGLFALATVVQLATLPVEFDASKRAKEQLHELGLASEPEIAKITEILNATAMTYLAALVDLSGFFSFRNWR